MSIYRSIVNWRTGQQLRILAQHSFLGPNLLDGSEREVKLGYIVLSAYVIRFFRDFAHYSIHILAMIGQLLWKKKIIHGRNESLIAQDAIEAMSDGVLGRFVINNVESF